MRNNSNNHLMELVKQQKHNISAGICSICSANKYVIEAAMLHAKKCNHKVLIESTSNQVNQDGGYTGMTPFTFADYVNKIADALGFPREDIILGADHLGPTAWQSLHNNEALAKAAILMEDCIKAGYTKIHIDTSMRCADDPGSGKAPLDDLVIAKRTAQLCNISETIYAQMSKDSPAPVYVIGTEVPVPGGSQEAESSVDPTAVDAAKRTITLIRETFIENHLESAWDRVIALVVQPGVEFSDMDVVPYNRQKALRLSQLIKNYDQMVYEAHSTDYQTAESLKNMVEDHFAILKVGPWLTFAFREAIFALESIEKVFLQNRKDVVLSKISDIINNVMVQNPQYWHKYYHGSEDQKVYARQYSYSDRIRYYWPYPEVQKALLRLINNLECNPCPLTLISQYLPNQYEGIRRQQLCNAPISMIHDKIMEVINTYSYACNPKMVLR